MGSKTTGSKGEAMAADFLAKQGYTILAQNYHSRYGEIDIIAQSDNRVAFVEVKLRKNDSFAKAHEAVTKSKQKKIILTALQWIEANPFEADYSFDIIEVYTSKGKIIHIKNAFEFYNPLDNLTWN